MLKKGFLSIAFIFILFLLSFSRIGFSQESSVAGGFEMSGHLLFGSGWQRYRTSAAAHRIAQDVRGTTFGPIGSYATGARVNREDEFKMFLDEVELDIVKHFDDAIRLRADLDFGGQALYGEPRFSRAAGNTDDVGVLVEQVYGTVPFWKGEVLLGRFNAPMGLESVDAIDNPTISRSILYRALRPISFTGAKLYYPFGDSFAWEVFTFNNGLTHDDGDVVDVNTDTPGGGSRLALSWGEAATRSHVGLSGAVGQDHGNFETGWSFIGDLDWEWWLSDRMAVAGEGLYRQIDTRTTNRINGKYYAGLLRFYYDFADEWDFVFRYSHAHDINGTAEVASVLGTGAQSLTGGGNITGAQGFGDQIIHEAAVGGSYAITDRAKLKMEAGYAYLSPSGGNNGQQVFGAVGALAYQF